ncbi:hypothetical protein BGZ60DRAFT_531650 [Tricladium varicosporioides]|nr:hypothetical protein BGZ60DRAFT_531650 [Hymenoscyphus varicosporioides]
MAYLRLITILSAFILFRFTAAQNTTFSPLEFYLTRCDTHNPDHPTDPATSSYSSIAHYPPNTTVTGWPAISGLDTYPYVRWDSGRIAHVMLYSPNFRGIATVNISSSSRGQKLGLVAGTLEFGGEVYPCERLYGVGMYAFTSGTECRGAYCMNDSYCAGRYRCAQGWTGKVNDCSVHGVDTCHPLWDNE